MFIVPCTTSYRYGPYCPKPKLSFSLIIAGKPITAKTEQHIISTVYIRRCYTKQDLPLEHCDTFPAFSEIEQSVNLSFDFSFQRQFCEKKKTSIPFFRQFSYDLVLFKNGMIGTK